MDAAWPNNRQVRVVCISFGNATTVTTACMMSLRHQMHDPGNQSSVEYGRDSPGNCVLTGGAATTVYRLVANSMRLAGALPFARWLQPARHFCRMGLLRKPSLLIWHHLQLSYGLH